MPRELNVSDVEIDSTTSKVVDSTQDVATDKDGNQMQITLTGRVTMQKIWVRTQSVTGHARTAIKYNPATDAPALSTMSISPTEEEVGGPPHTHQYLVVGLVDAEEPDRFSKESASGAAPATMKRARQTRGVIPVPSKWLRVVVKVTDFIENSVKYYVACNPQNGICEIKVINSAGVFYFDEFFSHIPVNANKALRSRSLGAIMRVAAATDQSNSTMSNDEPALSLNNLRPVLEGMVNAMEIMKAKLDSHVEASVSEQHSLSDTQS